MSQAITVFTTMKNEGPYMLEWVAFHKTLGVDHFVIFTNDCEDGTDDIARRLQELGVASHVPNEVKEGGNPAAPDAAAGPAAAKGERGGLAAVPGRG